MPTRRQAIAIMIASAAASAAPSKPNFSGRWRLDGIHSAKDSPAEMIETIDHREPLIRIDTDWDRNQATGVTNAALLAPTVELKSDGSENSSNLPLAMSLSTKTHWDGDKLVTDWRLNGLKTPLAGTWTRYLTGPNTMVVDSIAESNGHRNTARFIFIK